MTTAEEHERNRQARSFGAAADPYERGRPPYWPEAVAWLVPEHARTVVALGAGTGKLTRALQAQAERSSRWSPRPGCANSSPACSRMCGFCKGG